ncbi:hypothetical protein BJ741DRAFT_711693 [Chytriomyces cf. hyalinus JEL632]|nr:hypothetical protein BJ741DRAFT_711693 [Chytriomyces cf. hyalinus JEL632]
MSTHPQTDEHAFFVPNAVAAAVAVVGIPLSACVMAAVVKYRASLLEEMKRQTRNIDYAILSILVSAASISFLQSLENTLTNIKANGILGKVPSGYVLNAVSWLWLFALFSSNMALSMERLWLVRYSASVSAHYIAGIFGFTGLFYGVFVASVLVSLKNASITWQGFLMPFFIPIEHPPYVHSQMWNNSQPNPHNWNKSHPLNTNQSLFENWSPSQDYQLTKTLFLAAISFFPITACITLFLYLSAYFTIRAAVKVSIDGPTDSERASTELLAATTFRRTTNNEIPSSQIPPSRAMPDSGTNGLPVSTRAIFIRCLVMSAGLLVFYIPTIAAALSIYSLIDNRSLFFGEHSFWVGAMCAVLPATDSIWTPVVVLWCQTGYRHVFFRMFRNIRRRLLA